jgi:hypothetical protein
LQNLNTARVVLEALGHNFAESVLGTKDIAPTKDIASSSAGLKAVSSERIPSVESAISLPSSSESIPEQAQTRVRMPRALFLKEILETLMKESSPIHATKIKLKTQVNLIEQSVDLYGL